MFSFATKYNKTNFGIDTKEFTYTKLSDIFNSEKDGGADVIHIINGIYIHTTQLGESAVIVDATNKQMVNLPQHLVTACHSILADAEAVDAIKQGKVGYTIYEYEARGRKCYSIRFVDLNN